MIDARKVWLLVHRPELATGPTRMVVGAVIGARPDEDLSVPLALTAQDLDVLEMSFTHWSSERPCAGVVVVAGQHVTIDPESWELVIDGEQLLTLEEHERWTRIAEQQGTRELLARAVVVPDARARLARFFAEARPRLLAH